MSLFSNIIAPLVAGLFFLLYFGYFIIANPSRASSYWYFIVFLVGMSIFSLGRPLQLILGSNLFNRRRAKGLETTIVSIGVQVVTGALMFLSSSITLARLKFGSSFRDLFRNKHFLFNGGVSIYTVAFNVGSLTKKREIYYTVSIPSAALFGWSSASSCFSLALLPGFPT
ncbi:MAG: hypothetical protein CVV53_02275 [Spirochaetae bacterium HGW-Spirochaetae-9]|nr:MAG: hypothetical protein CVV53_02275 [Spirochaetae bacterium HGW-Spirochaetae-9]